MKLSFLALLLLPCQLLAVSPEAVYGKNGMVTSRSALASEVGINVMREGGNAVDAAIAASICLSVVEPNSTGIGGDCFAIVKMENKDPISYNGSGIAPKKANFEFFESKWQNNYQLYKLQN